MKFVWGRLASIAYLWILCWSIRIIKSFRDELMPDGQDWLSVFAWGVTILGLVTGGLGIIMSWRVGERVKALALPISLCIILSVATFTYVICLRDRVLNNFTKAVQHLLPDFDIDNRDDWDTVKDQMMQFGSGLQASYGQGLTETVRRHYYRYVTGWGSDIVNLFGGSGILMPIIAMGLTLWLVNDLKRLKARKDSDEAAAAAGEIVEVPTPQQYQLYSADLNQTAPQPQYQAPPAMFPTAIPPQQFYQQPLQTDPRFTNYPQQQQQQAPASYPQQQVPANYPQQQQAPVTANYLQQQAPATTTTLPLPPAAVHTTRASNFSQINNLPQSPLMAPSGVAPAPPAQVTQAPPAQALQVPDHEFIQVPQAVTHVPAAQVVEASAGQVLQMPATQVPQAPADQEPNAQV